MTAISRPIRFTLCSLWTLVYCTQIADCSERWPEPSDVWRRGYTFLILTSTYLLPLSILSITYGLVIGKLWRRHAPGNADSARDSQQLRSKRRVSIEHICRKKTLLLY